jgi:hypothetical protein
MTKVLLAAAIATLLATSSAHADDKSFENSYESPALAYAAPARTVESAYDTSVRALSAEVQEFDKPMAQADTLSPFAWIAEKIIEGASTFAIQPIPGAAVAFAR